MANLAIFRCMLRHDHDNIEIQASIIHDLYIVLTYKVNFAFDAVACRL